MKENEEDCKVAENDEQKGENNFAMEVPIKETNFKKTKQFWETKMTK